MSKEVVKRSSKSAIILPAHAKETERNSNLLERSLNSGIVLAFNIPTAIYAQVGDAHNLPLGLIGLLGSLFAVFTIPNLSGSELEIKTFRQAINERFSKIPGLHFFANGMFHSSDGNKNIMIQMKHGKSIVYDITQPNPKDLWDKMYESETGRVVSKDFSLLSRY